MEQNPRSVELNFELGLLIVRNVRTTPHVGYDDDGKHINGSQITHDMIFRLDNSFDTTKLPPEMIAEYRKSLINEAKQLVIDFQKLLRPDGPAAFDKTPEANINDLRMGKGRGANPLPTTLRAIAKLDSLDDCEQAMKAARGRKATLAKRETAAEA